MATPIGQLLLPPHQVFTQDFVLPVIAQHHHALGGVASVQFSHQQGATNVTHNALAPQKCKPFTSEVWAYCHTVPVASFIDGQVTTTVTITSGEAPATTRVLTWVWWCNRTGTLVSPAANPIAYVDELLGDNGTGDGTPELPFADIWHALVFVAGGSGQDCSDGTIYLKAGTYRWMRWENGQNLAANSRWVTIKPAPAVTREQVTIDSTDAIGSEPVGPARLKVQDCQVNALLRTAAAAGEAMWLHNCTVFGTARTDEVGIPATGQEQDYLTQCTVTTTRLGAGARSLAIDVAVDHAEEEAFGFEDRDTAAVVNCSAQDVRQLSTPGATVAVVPMRGANTNCLVYGLRATDFAAAGLLLAATASVNGGAVVDALLRAELTGTAAAAIAGDTTHLLLRHLLVAQPLRFDATQTHVDLELTNSSIRQAEISAGTQAQLEASTGWLGSHNHFWPESLIALGTNVVGAGTPLLPIEIGLDDWRPVSVAGYASCPRWHAGLAYAGFALDGYQVGLAPATPNVGPWWNAASGDFAAEPPDDAGVTVLAGQSNADGLVNFTEITTPAAKAMVLQPHPNVLIAGTLGAPATWQNYQASVNSGSILVTDIGPECGIAARLLQTIGKKVRILKAIGVGPLAMTEAVDWSSYSANEFFDGMKNQITTLIVNQGRQPTRFVWIHGEADALSPLHAAVYADGLKRMLAELVVAFPSITNICVVGPHDLYPVPAQPGVNMVRQQQREVCQDLSKWFYETRGQGYGVKNDLTHYDGPSVYQLGVDIVGRLAEDPITPESEEGPTAFWRPNEDLPSIFDVEFFCEAAIQRLAGGEGRPIQVYVQRGALEQMPEAPALGKKRLIVYVPRHEEIGVMDLRENDTLEVALVPDGPLVPTKVRSFLRRSRIVDVVEVLA